MKISAGIFFKFRLACCFSALLIAGCGKIGDPLPPIPRAPLVIDELKVEQQGSQLALSFPLVRTPRATRLQRIDIYRMIEPVSAPIGLPQETFSTSASVIHSFSSDQIPTTSSTIVFRDPLDLKSSAPSSRYRYAIRLVTSSGTSADFSNYATIVPLFDLALPPTDIKILQRESEIEISWTPPAANESGTAPANVTAYNLYRRPADSNSTFIKLNAEPLREPRFIDRNFQFGARYEYAARSLSLLPGEANLTGAIESNESQAVAHAPKDVFPPSAPTPITIASIAGIVSLYWPLNPEPDVVGYNIYRSEIDNAAADQWIKLTPQLHKTASFRDDRVMVGKQYFYQIAAVDAFGNESPRSATVSETVNQ